MIKKPGKQFSTKEQQDYAFRMRFSRFKVWISKKDGHNATYYGREASCTILQIMFKKVSELCLDRKKGLDECIRIVEKTNAGKYVTAIIYDRYHHRENGKWHEREIRKYINGNLVECEDIHFNEHSAKPWYQVEFASDDTWSLKHIPTPTQFKQLVSQALTSPPDKS
ncbi:MAG: hypothetical protein V4722_04420 [Bacteroidota bacterium]